MFRHQFNVFLNWLRLRWQAHKLRSKSLTFYGNLLWWWIHVKLMNDKSETAFDSEEIRMLPIWRNRNNKNANFDGMTNDDYHRLRVVAMWSDKDEKEIEKNSATGMTCTQWQSMHRHCTLASNAAESQFICNTGDFDNRQEPFVMHSIRCASHVTGHRRWHKHAKSHTATTREVENMESSNLFTRCTNCTKWVRAEHTSIYIETIRKWYNKITVKQPKFQRSIINCKLCHQLHTPERHRRIASAIINHNNFMSNAAHLWRSTRMKSQHKTRSWLTHTHGPCPMATQRTREVIEKRKWIDDDTDIHISLRSNLSRCRCRRSKWYFNRRCITRALVRLPSADRTFRESEKGKTESTADACI